MENKTLPKKLPTQITLEDDDPNDLDLQYVNTPRTNFPSPENISSIIRKKEDFLSKNEEPSSQDSNGLEILKPGTISLAEAGCRESLPNEVPNESLSKTMHRFILIVGLI